MNNKAPVNIALKNAATKIKGMRLLQKLKSMATGTKLMESHERVSGIKIREQKPSGNLLIKNDTIEEGENSDEESK